MIRPVDTAPHGVETSTLFVDYLLAGVREASGARGACGPVPGTTRSIHTQLQRIGSEISHPRDDTGPHGMETPTPGTTLLAGVREAGRPHPMGARKLIKFVNPDLIEYVPI